MVVSYLKPTNRPKIELGFLLDMAVLTGPLVVTTCGGEFQLGDSIKIPAIIKKEWQPIEYYTCSWTITVPEGKVVEAKFSNFDVGAPPALDEYSASCLAGLRVGLIANQEVKYCGTFDKAGNSPLSRLVSSNNTMKVRFSGDRTQERSASFQAIDPDSVMLQYVMNWVEPPAVQGSEDVRQNMSTWISYEGNKTVEVWYGRLAQLIHPKGTTSVKIDVILDQRDLKASFESGPTQSLTVTKNGIYKVDRPGDESPDQSSQIATFKPIANE